MPIIEFQDQPIPLFNSDISFAVEVDGAVRNTFRLTSSINFSATANIVGLVTGEIDSDIDFTATANGHLVGEPDVFGEIESAINFTGVVNGKLSGSFVLTSSIDFTAEIDGDEQAAETYTLMVTVTVRAPNAIGNYKQNSERLYIDGTEVAIRRWSCQQDKRDMITTVEVELADIAQRSLINENSQITFETGTWNPNTEEWEWRTEIENGLPVSTQHGFGSGDQPDTFAFFGESPLQGKLRTAPSRDTVVYDPTKHSLEVEDFPVVLDTEGNQYITELVPREDLDLHWLLDYVFKTQAGYHRVQPSIENFPIDRIEFTAGVPYVQVIKEYLGVFEPDMQEIGSGSLKTLWIRSGVGGYPAGMPAPRQITPSWMSGLSVSADIKRVDAFLMTYQESRDNYDYFNDRVETPSPSTTGWPGDRVSTTTETTYRDYFRNSRPFTPVRTELIKEVKTTRYNSVVFSRITEQRLYNRFGNLRNRKRTTEARLPNPFQGFTFQLLKATEVTEDIIYRPHPFDLTKQYVHLREIRERGLVVTDGTNTQLGEDYSRSMLQAFRAGNVAPEMIGAERVNISLVEERIRTITKDTITVQVREIDYLSRDEAGNPLVVRDEPEDRAADVGQSAMIAEQNRMFVPSFLEGGNIEDINVGVIPVRLAVPLVNLIRLDRRNRPGEGRVELPYIDDSLQKGSAVNLIGREDENLGIFIIEGRRMSGERSGYGMSLEVKQA